MKSAIQFLYEWAGQESWKIHVVNKVISKREIDTSDLLKEVMKLYCSNENIDVYIDLVEEREESTRLIINEIQSPLNINALSNESDFSLGENLNVFYGENGSGKSSYIRMFRKLADNYVTSEKDFTIFPNVYDKGSVSANGEQTVKIKYLIGNVEKDEVIDLNIEHPNLRKLNIFDSESVIPLIDNDLSFSILPKGFDYFQDVSNMLDELRNEISYLINFDINEQEAIFKDSTFDFIREDIERVTQEVTNKEDIKVFLDLNYPRSETYLEDKQSIELQIKELEADNPSDKLKILFAQKEKLTTINEAFVRLAAVLSVENINAVNLLLKDYAQRLDEESEFNKSFSENVSYLSVVNDEWISFIKSGREYYNSTSTIKISQNEPCIFCSQPLKSENVELIEKNFDYLSDSKAVMIASIEKEIKKHEINRPLNQLSEEDAAFIESKKLLDKIKASIQLVDRNKDIFNEFINSKQRIPGETILDLSDIIDDIKEEIESLLSRMQALNKKNEDLVNTCEALKAHELILKKNEKLHRSLGMFIEWFERKNRIESYTTIKKKFSTKKLTQKQSEAFKTIVHDEYLKTFQEFAGKLKVPFVDLKMTPKKGITLRNKFISSEEYKVSQVLSEGEQKSVAIAEFATDLTMRKDYNPLLFDDPVNSLDYKRTELIASLIHQLSTDRQVIVFTHNIMFYYNLYNASGKKKNGTDKFFKVDEIDKMNKGFVSESFTGRLENLGEITRKLNAHKETINSRKCFGDQLEGHLKKAYSDIRTWCELIIEEGFLKSIIRRYEPNIMFSSIKNIDGTFINELEAVSNLFDKACRWMAGHSQPIESQHVTANKEAFNDDLIYIFTVNKKYKNS